MKSNNEIEFYKRLKNKMIIKAELLKVNWARYYATVLNLGGVHSEQYLKNYFNDDNKKLSSEQLATILMDLENITDVRPINQDQLQDEVLRMIGEIGELTRVMKKELDEHNDISLSEAVKLLPKTRNILVLAEELHIRLEETKSQGDLL
jgi:GGDEF domain-containing protein